MTLLTSSGLFGDSGVPLTVRDVTDHRPSGAVTAESVKVVFTLSGRAEIDTARDEIEVQAGSTVTIPAGVECWGFRRGMPAR